MSALAACLVAAALGAPTAAGAATVSFFDTLSAAGELVDITSGPDDALWYASAQTDPDIEDAGRIGRMTTAGVATEFAIPGSIHPECHHRGGGRHAGAH